MKRIDEKIENYLTEDSGAAGKYLNLSKYEDEQPAIKCCENCEYARMENDYDNYNSCFSPDNVKFALATGYIKNNRRSVPYLNSLGVCPRFKR